MEKSTTGKSAISKDMTKKKSTISKDKTKKQTFFDVVYCIINAINRALNNRTLSKDECPFFFYRMSFFLLMFFLLFLSILFPSC
ncbi:hypothetical protein CC1_21360 [Coprococcus catus GD/7]|uniref:Uncharacterized protein n=1 Tax=Coprococcus catus GD/7 TaxID=717962 RepID=D4J921_9FIRM|nr:hypothetical protein CC1_21360 [Coprococcus catus GD/7]